MRKTLLFLLLLSLHGVVSATTSTTHEFTLDNGLKLLVREDHRAPVVVSQVWYKVGSSYEPDGITGISHMLEHMMFKGTPTLGPGEFSRLIAAQGGEENAFTSRDYTAYFQKLEKERLEISFRLEADRMRHLSLNSEDFTKEAQVVAEERRLRTEDDPESQTSEQFSAISFVTSPYHHPIIGWMHDIKALQVQDLRAWYERWYAPNNAVLVVVGDVDPQHVLKLAKTYFGPLQPSPVQAVKYTPEIPQKGGRRVVVKAPAKLPYLIMGYKTPSLVTAEQDWEPYALEVLEGILDGGDSARLSHDLVRGSEVAASANAGYSLVSRLEDQFVLSGNPAPGHDVAELEQALRGQVKRLREDLVSRDELDRVIAQVIAAEVYQRDSMFYQGMRMGILETVGLGWGALDDYVQRVKSVTPEQIRAVAQKYLSDDNLTVAILDPLPLAEGQAVPTGAGPQGALVH
ncbi:MAG: insulinase family protein [Gammaproteobacteria bacterium]|nr:insulinase family protein [Gammaproteobacteria bacterium]MCP5425633.1 insulinase family protein [Gammaproteobacteria bacterium]MCP5458969.1 insulinase family protein [Gammaproteobacteria bacterium]